MSKIVDYRALHQKVLCVAVTRVEGAWCAYIKNVPGGRHTDETADVKAHGDKLPENIALAIFPQFKDGGLPYAW